MKTDFIICPYPWLTPSVFLQLPPHHLSYGLFFFIIKMFLVYNEQHPTAQPKSQPENTGRCIEKIYLDQIVVIKRQQFSLFTEASITFSVWLSNWVSVAYVGGFQNLLFQWVVWWLDRKSRQMSRQYYHRWMQHLGAVPAGLQLNRSCSWALQRLHSGSWSMCWGSWCWHNWHWGVCLGESPGRRLGAGKPRKSLELAANSWKLLQELSIQDREDLDQNLRPFILCLCLSLVPVDFSLWGSHCEGVGWHLSIQNGYEQN